MAVMALVMVNFATNCALFIGIVALLSALVWRYCGINPLFPQYGHCQRTGPTGARALLLNQALMTL